MDDLSPGAGLPDRLLHLEGLLAHERDARADAERQLERMSRALDDAHLALAALRDDDERRVEDRTRETTDARRLALTHAETDPLTGIANRAAFTRRLHATLGDATRDGEAQGVVVLLIDLDDFKSINDTLGHPAGDALLVEAARRLSEAVRPGDAVARLGGDEFAVIAHGVGMRPHGLQLAQRLLEVLSSPMRHDGRDVYCHCSIGLAEAQADALGADVLLGNANLALCASKRGGRGRVTCFEAGLRATIERRIRLDSEVRDAVLGDRIEPWYQPVADGRSGRFVSAELLARWHPAGGTVRPAGDFLPTVERLGLLDTMMENMLRRALPEALPLVQRGVLDYLAVNVSPTQFNQGWAQRVLPQLLADAGFPAHALMVEITETALLHDIDEVRSMLDALTGLGMRIAIDDFGVGYSNFSLLRQLPFDLLKLDRSLSCDIETDEPSRAVVDCILALAARLDIPVVAEGVETRRQCDVLQDAGCDVQQGFLHARPARDLAAAFSAALRPVDRP